MYTLYFLNQNVYTTFSESKKNKNSYSDNKREESEMHHCSNN